jgi:tetratricopeptide (TPR) repeat protein
MLIGRLDEALIYMEEGRRMKEEMGLWSVHYSLANIGNVYLARGENERARDYYQKALAIASSVADSYSVARWTHNLALTFSRSGAAERAKELANKSAALYDWCGDMIGASETNQLAYANA